MPMPLTHARIGYDTITRRGTIVASGELTGSPASAAANEMTYSHWRVGIPATWEVQLDSPETVDYFGIAAHDLTTQGIHAELQAFIEDDWQTRAVLAPGVLGEIWPFDESYRGLRGTDVVDTIGSFRRGVGVDGRPIHGVGNPVRDSKFGSHAFTIEPATENVLPENVRTGTDSGEDTTGFTATDATITSSTERAASGSRSLKVVITEPAGGSVSIEYNPAGPLIGVARFSAQLKLSPLIAFADEEGLTVATFSLSDDDGESDSMVIEGANPDRWERAELTLQTGAAATTVTMEISTDGPCTFYLDELQLERALRPTTWVNGTRLAGDLKYPRPGWVSSVGDATINMWVLTSSDLSIQKMLWHSQTADGANLVSVGLFKKDLSGDLSDNGDFEDGDTGWDLTGDAEIIDVGSAPPGFIFAGTYGLVLVTDGDEAVNQQVIDVIPGQAYRLGFVLWAIAGGIDTTTVFVRFYDEADNLIDTHEMSFESTADFDPYELTGVAPDGAVTARFGALVDDGGQAAADNFAFEIYENNRLEVHTRFEGGDTHVLPIPVLDPDPWSTVDWHMITVVLKPTAESGVNKLLYMDGTLVASATVADLPSTWADMDVWVGNYLGADRLDWDSFLDDLTVVNYAATAVEISAWFTGGVMTLANAQLPTHLDNRPIMKLVEETTASRFRILLSGDASLFATIGVIYIGKALEMYRPIYGGHAPISMSRVTVIRPNVSDGGQFLGRRITRSGVAGSWTWNNLPAAWVRSYLDRFIEAARLYPFFISWRPASFPLEVGYCWTGGDQAPSNMGLRDFMTFTLEAEGHGG